jgi:FxsC-like protein
MGGSFFLSYARADNAADDNGDSSLVSAFFADLCEEIRQKEPTALADGSFLDSRIEYGALWEQHIHDAACALDVLVALTSPTYFRREWCGREWAIFAARGAGKGAVARRIIPLAWIDGPAHALAAPHQMTFDARNEDEAKAFDAYRGYGLRWMVKYRTLPQQSLSYGLVVREIANVVRAAASEGALPPLDRARATTIAPLFPIAPPPAKAATPSAPNGRAAGSAKAYFAALVGVASRISRPAIKIRYADDRRDWTPFVPASEEPLGVTLTRVALEAGLYPEWLDETADLPARIREAEDQKRIVIVVIDAWSTELDDLCERAALIDREHFDNCSIVVVWSDDPDSQPDLRARVRNQALRRTWKRRMVVEAKDPAGLARALGDAIKALHSALSPSSTPARELPPGDPMSVPTISAAPAPSPKSPS